MANIVVFGGAHLDRRGQLTVPFSAGASHPGCWHEEAGGGAFNAARMLSCLHHDVTFITPRGGDAAGELVSAAAEAANINDRPFIFLDRRTASYTVILDADGNSIVGLADMELYKLFTPRRLRVRSTREHLARSQAVLMDANLPQDTLSAIAKTAKDKGKFVGAIGISPAKIVSLRPVLSLIDMLFLNSAEALALTQKAELSEAMDALIDTGIAGFAITQGKEVVHSVFRGKHIKISPPPMDSIVDVTGAGDALAGAALSALINGEALEPALWQGIAAAQLTIASRHAFVPDLSLDRLKTVAAQIEQPSLVTSNHSQPI